MFNTHSIFAFAADAQAKGQRVVLVTLYAVSGTSSRNPGAHLAVSEDGAYAGSLSDGCVEGAIASEALRLLAEGGPRELRLGQGSAYIDIRLPCGGAVDLLFNELPQGEAARLLALIERREAFRIRLPRGPGAIRIQPGPVPRFGLALSADAVEVRHVPPLRLVMLGHGPTVLCLHDLAVAARIDVEVVTQDDTLARALHTRGRTPVLLKGVGSVPPLGLDRWTACALFFHDHEWEPALLRAILGSLAFYVGAMGSRATHAQRCAMLSQAGMSEGDIARIQAPIGLIPSLRDPETLAVSTLAQAIDAYNRSWL